MNKRVFIHLCVIFLIGLIPLLWFKGGAVILGHDSGLPLDPITHFIDRFYVWSQRFGIGTDQSAALLGAFFIHGLEALLSFLGFSMQLEQKLQFVFWFTLPGLAMYFFVNKVWPEKKHMPLVASLIYMVNYYLIQGWFVAERTKFSIYIALPIVLYFLFSYLTRKVSFLPSVMFAGLTLGFLNGGGSFPLYGGMIVAVFLAYLYINIVYFNFETLRRTILFSLGVVIVYTLLNSYWLITYYYYVLSFFSRDLANAGGADGVLTWVKYLSKGSNFMNLLRGQGIPEWYLNDFHPYAQTLMNNPLFKFISFGFPFLVVFPIVVIKSNKDRFYAYFLIILALAGIFLSAGTNSPLSFLFEALVRHVPGFVMFRSAYYKFDYVVWFSYAVLIGLAIDFLLVKIKEKKPKLLRLSSSSFFLAIFIVIYLFYHYPIFNGVFFDYNNDPNGKLTTRVTVPSYVFEFGKWSNAQDPSRRYLVLPELNDSSYISYDWGFWSLAPLTSLLSKNSFVQNSGLVAPSERLLMKQMYSALLNRDFDSFLDYADIFAVDSLVVQEDYDWKSIHWGTTDPKKYEDVIASSPMFKLEKEFGKWKVYKIVNRDKSRRITISNSLNFLQGELSDVVSFPYFSPKKPLYMGSTGLPDDAFFAKSASDIFIGAKCIACDLKDEGSGFVVYNPKLLPGSFLYKYVVTANEDKVKIQSNDFVSKVNYYLTTGDRRSVEIKWMVEFRQNLGELQNTLVRHNESLKKLKSELSKSDWGIESDQEESLAKTVIGHLLTEASLIASVHNDDMVNLENRMTLASSYETLTGIIDMIRDKQWVTEGINDKKYLYRLPSTGEYEVYVKKSTLTNPLGNITQSSIFAREYGATLKPINTVRDWINFGPLDLTTNLLHLSFTDSTVTNLADGVSAVNASGNSGIKKISNSYVMTGDSINKCFSIPIKNLEVGEDKKYIVSFSYRNFTDNKTLSFSVDDKIRSDASLRTKETLLPSKQNWTSFKASFIPSKKDVALNFCNGFTSINDLEGPGPWLNFEATNHGIIVPEKSADKETGVDVTQVRDIAFYKLTEPNIVLYKKVRESVDENANVLFTKKNPVEYVVNLKKSAIPTFVTMRESFGKYWKVCDEHKNCLPFDTRLHFPDAGFLNTWYFENGIGSKLDFYYYPQRTFLIGGIVSGLSFLVAIGYTIYYFKSKKKKK